MMMGDELKTRHATEEDLDVFVDFAYRINRQLERSSSFCSKSEHSIRIDLLGSTEHQGLAGAWKSGMLIGIISTYMDELKHNIDCFILIDSNLCNYEETAKLLLDYVRKGIDQQFHFTFFFSKENVECSTFLKSLNAFQKPNEYGLLLIKENKSHGVKSDSIQLLPALYHQKFIELHDEIFPDVYISGKEIIDSLGKNRHVFAWIEDDQIKAYSVLFLRGNLRATAEIIAVHQDFRGKGLGKKILNHLIHAAFYDFGLEAVDLIVDSDNLNALKLYLDIGFAIEFENHCYILS